MKTISTEQARRIDREAQQILGMSSLCLMENAGRNVADVVERKVKVEGPVVVFAGCGNNGGDGFVAARHLHIRGYHVQVVLVGDKNRMSTDCAVNYNICVNCGIPVTEGGSMTGGTVIPPTPTVVIDALLGTGLKGEVREPYTRFIEKINETDALTVSVDTPSGLDCDTGMVLGCCVEADVTVTFVLPKKGFFIGDGPRMTGEIVTADIGIPVPRWVTEGG